METKLKNQMESGQVLYGGVKDQLKEGSSKP